MGKISKFGIVTLSFLGGAVVGFLGNQVYHNLHVAQLAANDIKTTFTEHKEDPAPEIKMQDIIKVDTLKHAYVYYPQFSKIDLICGQRPNENDDKIILATDAAFTGKVLKEFNHENVAGNHVSNGVFYKGYACPVNTGAFSYYKKNWYFHLDNYDAQIAKAADNEGMAFAQALFIHRGKRVHCEVQGKNNYHALCKKDGKLCLIESREPMDFFSFVMYLLDCGVQEALYLDLGKGFWHDNAGATHALKSNGKSYNTNWIVFYK